MSKRNVFLFGAGAAIDWGGPKTSCLTDLLTKVGFKAKDGKTITSKIKETLDANGFSTNFETILSVIEELIIYFSGFQKSSGNKSFINLFFCQNNLLSSFSNYSIVGDAKSTYSLKIPDHEAESSKISAGQNPDQFFFELLLINLYTTIENRIDKYSHSYNGKQRSIESNENQELNNSFHSWINNFIIQNETVRLYNLNYDRLFQIILKNRNYEVVEGFGNEFVSHTGEKLFKPDIQRIITDTDSLCCYNMHGCINWRLEKLKNNKTFLPFLREGPHLSFNYGEYPKFKIEEGKSGIHTSIIAGYQKAQRSALSPYKQMQCAFERDCFTAENLYIVGFSFSDEHINETIRMALIFNSKLKIHIIDCGFLDNIELKYFSEFSQLIGDNHQKITDGIYNYGNTYAYNYEFGYFLKNYDSINKFIR